MSGEHFDSVGKTVHCSPCHRGKMEVWLGCGYMVESLPSKAKKNWKEEMILPSHHQEGQSCILCDIWVAVPSFNSVYLPVRRNTVVIELWGSERVFQLIVWELSQVDAISKKRLLSFSNRIRHRHGKKR